MKRILLIMLLFTAVNVMAQELPWQLRYDTFDIKSQTLRFFTDSLDAITFMTLVDSRLDYKTTISNPLVEWTFDNKCVYVRKVGTIIREKYSKVKHTYLNNYISAGIREYKYILKNKEIDLYYNIREDRWQTMTIIDRGKNWSIRIYSMYQPIILNPQP